jgi:hypothetical protein
MWDLWWTKWHWDRFFPEYFGFPLSISFLRCSITRKGTMSSGSNITGLRNVGNYSPNVMASHPRILESSATPIREPEISCHANGDDDDAYARKWGVKLDSEHWYEHVLK